METDLEVPHSSFLATQHGLADFMILGQLKSCLLVSLFFIRQLHRLDYSSCCWMLTFQGH